MRSFREDSAVWTCGLAAALALLAWACGRDIGRPWTDNVDANGACWSQSAHNTLRAGLRATAGVPSAFYFGSPPIPEEGFYAHHPPLLSLLLTVLFAALGEKEWVARLLPVTCSLLGVFLLWELVRRCVNLRAAAFCAVIFAATPMELHYGSMVNFEPLDLVWMLGALLCLQRWEQNGKKVWCVLFLGSLLLALWTAWLGYLFTAILAIHLGFFPSRGGAPGLSRRRVAAILVALIASSFALFLFQVSRVQPGAWADMMDSVRLRMAGGGDPVPWAGWARRMMGILGGHFQRAVWLLAVLGGGVVISRRRLDRGMRWLGWAVLCFLGLSAFYVVVFRNASSIHDYASFYFGVPLAMLGGVALDCALRWSEIQGTRVTSISVIAALGLCVYLAVSGQRQELALRRPFRILDSARAEPADLIPQLGAAIKEEFAEDTAVICNFVPSYGPQLHYYAQRDLLNCAFTAGDWQAMSADPANAPVGGVVWIDAPGGSLLLSTLPPGTVTKRFIRGIAFGFWHPGNRN